MRAPRTFLVLAALVVGALFTVTGAISSGGVSGAIFTTDAACSGVNINIFEAKDAVRLDGGPAHPNAAGLPDGSYYAQVTAPDGALLGTTVGSASETPVHVTAGSFDECYQLSAILIKASDGTAGYDTTPNPGGEYKVWVSDVSSFDSSSSKTDNFKVKAGEGPPPSATLNVKKFYDADANGTMGQNEPFITGWKVNIHDGIIFDRFTPVSMVVDPDDYTVTEYAPVEPNWYGTTANPVNVTLANGDNKTVTFGNVCTIPGSGGLTLGFWSNKNGQGIMNGGDLTALQNLNLRNANGSDFNPTTNAQVKSWLLSATATNMAYMLSAQLTATTLDVRHGVLADSQLIYAPALTTYGISNGAGFTTIGAVRDAANAELGLHGLTLSGNAYRAYQEALKNVLDGLNNNTVAFASSTPCPFSFATS
jgi:hypothetical protein